jgi:PAS domain S-box-containing protein
VFDLVALSLSDLLQCSSAMRQVARDARTMEEAAGAVVTYLHGHFINKLTGDPSLALVRLYKTHPYGALEPALQDAAQAVCDMARPPERMPCLTLLATAGVEPAWNDRTASRGHKAIPLPSEEALARSPMVLQLVTQLGLDVQQVIEPDPALFRELEAISYRVFFVEDALDSPSVPAQNDFVVPYGIRSVLGFGGVLPDGSLFAVVLFSTMSIPSATADAFSSVALSVKAAILPFAEGPIFTSELRAKLAPPVPDTTIRLLESQVITLNQLLEVRELTVVQQSTRLEHALEAERERANELADSRYLLAVSESRKGAVVDAALDCVITMDAQGRVLEFNRAAEGTFGYSRQEVVGELLADLIIPYQMRRRHTDGIAHYVATGEGPLLNRRIEVTAMRRDGTEFPAELTVIRVPDTDPPLFTGFVRDITEVRRVDTALLEGRERMAHVARVLQSSLLPPALPTIPGIKLAAGYRAAGDGLEVGGDFYDAFEIAPDRWALKLGDVCGKGPEAAALTALARHTMRAAALRASRPTEVLAVLNEAINRSNPDQFCTVAYIELRLEPGGVSMTLASGGHPPTYVLRVDGSLVELEAHGRLVGPFESWTGEDVTMALGDGDTVVLYSDGVIEARRGRELFGDERLRTLLRESAGLDPVAIVNRIEDAVLEFSDPPSDDIALLVAQVVSTG